jgi:multisubunit Na+/H+ antiporter MnhE subunit
MSSFFFIFFSGIVWMGLRGDIGVFNFVVGILLGFGLWRLFRFKSRHPFSIVGVIRLTFLGLSVFIVFLAELVLANLHQLRIVLAPRIRVSPYWLQYRTELETPAMRAVLGSIIVMTPGTGAYKETESEEGVWTIAVHALHAKDEEEAQKILDRIRGRFESRLRQMETL